MEAHRGKPAKAIPSQVPAPFQKLFSLDTQMTTILTILWNLSLASQGGAILKLLSNDNFYVNFMTAHLRNTPTV